MSDEDPDRQQDQQSDGNQQDRQGQRNQQGEQGQQNQQGGQGRQNQQDGQGQQNQGPPTAEKVLTGVSVAFTVLLFGYVVWQALQPPGGVHPQVGVTGTEQLPNGSVAVYVELTNPGDAGLISATVEANCDRPPPDTTLEYVPAGGHEQGVLVCPPGTTRPNASVSAWIPA